MRAPVRLVPLFVAVLAAGGSLKAQSLADRVARAPDGIVRFSFAARDGLCGDGRTFIRDRSDGEGSFITFDDDHSHWSGRSRSWRSRPCDEGPVRVSLRTRDHAVRRIKAYVGGDWFPDQAEGTDLGRVAAQGAVDGLIAIARDRNHPGGEDAVFIATLADSVLVWRPLLSLARDDGAVRDSRKNAVFWLSQLAGDAATQGLSELAEDETEDREIREQAVFALSQLPKESGVPILIRVARTNKDPQVRRKALFWLGQSEDPRALALFEEILVGKR